MDIARPLPATNGPLALKTFGLGVVARMVEQLYPLAFELHPEAA